MANNFIPVRLEYSGGSSPTGWAEYQTGETMTLPGGLNFSGSGRRFTADFSSGAGSLANRLWLQSSTVNGQTMLMIVPNGTSSISGVHLFSSTDVENSPLGVIQNNGSSILLMATATGAGAQLPLAIGTAGAERMRIAQNGEVFIGTTVAPIGNKVNGAMFSGGGLQANMTGGTPLILGVGNVSNSIGYFYYSGGSSPVNVGSISTNGTTTSYNTTSDRRLKDQIEDADADKAWSRLDSYRIRSFVYKSMPDVRAEYAGIADELQRVNPDMVTGEKDAMLAYGTVYTFRPVGTLYAQDGGIIAVEIEEPEDYSGYWNPTGAREFVEREDVLPPTDELPGKRWEKTREEILPQAVDWSKAVPELILNLQTAKAMILELQRELSEVRQAISA